MDISIRRGLTSKRVAVFITNANTGEGLSGLAYNSSGLNCYYWREDQLNVGATQVNLATATRGTWSTGGFVEKDAANMPGWYEFGIPNAALASGAAWVKIRLQGATNMVPVDINIELDGVKNVALPELAVGVPSSTPDYDTALMLLYMLLGRSEVVATDTVWQLKNDAGTVIIQRNLTKTSSDFTRGEMISG